jgi:hypothetical protein
VRFAILLGREDWVRSLLTETRKGSLRRARSLAGGARECGVEIGEGVLVMVPSGDEERETVRLGGVEEEEEEEMGDAAERREALLRESGLLRVRAARREGGGVVKWSCELEVAAKVVQDGLGNR